MNLIQFKVVALYDGMMATTTGMERHRYRLFSTAEAPLLDASLESTLYMHSFRRAVKTFQSTRYV
jgi:hypothetical protein